LSLSRFATFFSNRKSVTAFVASSLTHARRPDASKPFARSKWHYAKDILDTANLPLRRVIEKIGSIRNELMTIAKRERPRAPVCSWRSTISKVAQDSNDATVALDTMKHSLSVLNGISGVGNLRLRLAF
jgi:hypothetical protein